MKNFVLFLFVMFFCSGCVVRIEEKDDINCFNVLKSNIRVIVPDFMSTEIEEIAKKFEDENKDVKLTFVRVADDENYRTRVLDEILNKDASIFFIHGENDVNFFRNVIEPFELEKNKERVVNLQNATAFKMNKYISGLWVNLKILGEYGISEQNLKSYDGFFNSIRKIKEKNKKQCCVGIGEGIYSLICSLGFKEGEICSQFETILKFGGENDNRRFLNGDCVFYIGSDRELNREVLTKEKCFKCLPLPVSNNKNIVEEEDFFCLSNMSTIRKDLILKFLEFALKETKIEHLKQNKISETKNMPAGFKKEFEERKKEFRNRNISFNNMQKSLKRKYLKNKTLDCLYVS